MISSFRLRRLGRSKLWFILLIFIFFLAKSAYAIVGQGEKFDEFREEELTDFHKDLMKEETQEPPGTEQVNKLKQLKKKDLKQVDPKEKKAITKEIEKLEKELLGIPERDRFHFGADGDYKYDTNIIRNTPPGEKGDSVFDTVGYTEIDFSGRKTDLSLELRYGHQWNIHFPDKDTWLVEERLRYRRKYFKKITQSVQSRVTRNNENTLELDGNKIRYDLHQNMAVNYAFSKKLSINGDFSSSKRVFTQEPFDQDSSWEAKAAPAMFWNFTPKSRIQAGYAFGANRIRTKKGDTNSHDITLGYFGQITRKSSASVDFAFNHQTPRERSTAVSNTVTLGSGYIYQLSPKTQVTLQATRALQNTSSNLLPTADSAAAGPGAGDQVIKLDTFYASDNFSVSFNTRTTKKISAVLSGTIFHAFTRAEQAPPQEPLKTRQLTFPFSVSFNYVLSRSVRLRAGYAFTYRMGDERNDLMRSHTYSAGMTVTF